MSRVRIDDPAIVAADGAVGERCTPQSKRARRRAREREAARARLIVHRRHHDGESWEWGWSGLSLRYRLASDAAWCLRGVDWRPGGAGDDLTAYWERSVLRPDRPGSPYNAVRPLDAVKSWWLGLPYPMPFRALWGTWPRMEQRCRALERIAAAVYPAHRREVERAARVGQDPLLLGEVLAQVVPRLSTADLRRLSRLSPAALRALLGAAYDVAWLRVHGQRLRVMWDVVADLLRLLDVDARDRLRRARIPASWWLRVLLRGAVDDVRPGCAHHVAGWVRHPDRPGQSFRAYCAVRVFDEISGETFYLTHDANRAKP